MNTYGSDDNAGIGGMGGAGNDIDGEDGEGYLDPAADTNANGAGGGGGVGRIRINSSGSFTNDGTLSPSVSTSAFSEGLPPSY